MKRIALYNPSWHTMGGGEKFIAAIGSSLSRDDRYEVTLLAGDASLNAEKLRSVFNIDGSRMRYVVASPSDVRRELSTRDLSIVVSNFRSFGTPAPKNVLILQIPYGPITGGIILRKFLTGKFRESAKDVSRLSLLRDARRADLVLVYSSFVRDVLRTHHGIHAEVLHPAIDDFGPGGQKRKIILSVGRIFRGSYNDKRYDALIDGFKKLCAITGRTDWDFRIVGNAGTDSQDYLAALQRRAEGFPVRFFVNEPYARLREHFAEASIFWHGAGFGVDESRDPERTEHFGMTTVEAMSAGCVPVAVGNGGQKEIVVDGTSGYLWHTLDDLAAKTAGLIADSTLLARLSDGARQRFTDFDQAHFERRLRELFSRF